VDTFAGNPDHSFVQGRESVTYVRDREWWKFLNVFL
jgi:hypothetical protein